MAANCRFFEVVFDALLTGWTIVVLFVEGYFLSKSAVFAG
jgi:ABC-type transport system involved in cytochrome bd biosynthesis fused ATPase/permease subunit